MTFVGFMAKVMKKVSPTRRLTYDVRELGKWWVIEMLPHIHKSSPYIHNIHVLKMEKISIVAEKECFASKNLVQYHIPYHPTTTLMISPAGIISTGITGNRCCLIQLPSGNKYVMVTREMHTYTVSQNSGSPI